ncbi:DUF4998 domain-containing protein [Flavitalea sp. BT771]|uniref:DUF4998 domain-containing protein n=1 Tax=Flavitalea sp. BT771 TaxID=3063329 RepID=UPI0026E11B71|nr:DUF4998 domain-containing protein [Flavitalea sp. BT771]MDO6435683.1 DUF4998 domain-containing protein [Flavitalea sp. BT771]MDV6224584.1 DUF4998 domain-containing protein [Flavitalea sp. BT771]
MKNVLILILLITVGVWTSCIKANNYKKYTAGGEEIYPGKPDSLQAFPGRNRIQLHFLVQADPTVVGARIFWNGHVDSSDLLLKRTSGVDTVNTIIDGLAEGAYNFEVFTYDAKGDHSVTTYITARAYGADYEASLLNIPVASSAITDDHAGMVVWGAYDPLGGLVGARAYYTDMDGVSRDTTVPVNAQNGFAEFAHFPDGGTLEYRALYFPEPMAIDTFASAAATITISPQ